jgi:hypothetical protein
MEEEQDVLRDIEDDLASLIQDEGLTPTRLETFGQNIIKLFGVSSAAFIIEQIEFALIDMPKDKYTKALMYALGLNQRPEHWIDRLTGRREFLMEYGGEEFKGKSEDTLRRWERRAMPALARAVVARAKDKDLTYSYQDFVEEEGGSIDERLEAMQQVFDARILKLEARVILLSRKLGLPEYSD